VVAVGVAVVNVVVINMMSMIGDLLDLPIRRRQLRPGQAERTGEGGRGREDGRHRCDRGDANEIHLMLLGARWNALLA
jgi:hypothetical protein